MRLKALEIFGFKSFADRTLLKFGEGITIVVGPNGSGKSNIFDSIKWVLGTQSAKSLRGSKMEDIIFVGSDDRKTLGMAEVSLTLDNSDNSINMAYSEVKVTRRLYRSGDSEYFINDNQVRLKDVVELFMDTGVGIDSYSVISQGEVDRIINTKSEQRREIFEEAAGITKYIKKRDEALRKLETTEQDMLRINDILVEVKRQTASLERQAKRAEKYKVLKEEWSGMMIKLFMKDIKDKNYKYREFDNKKNEIDHRIEEENTKLSTHEMKYEEMKLNSLEKERDINEKKEKWIIKEQEIKRLEDNLKFLSQRHVELSQRIEDLKTDNIENAGKMEEIKVEIESKNGLLVQKDGGIKEQETVLGMLTGEVETVNAEYENLKNSRDQKNTGLEEKQNEINDIKGKIVEYDIAVKNILEQIEKGENSKKELEERLRTVKIDIEQLSENRVLKEEEIRSIKEKEAGLIKEKIMKSDARDNIENTLKQLDIGISRMESRYNFLKQMHEKLEGYGETVRKVLTEYKDGLEDEKKADIVDVVGNLMAVEPAFEAAVEKSFRGLLESVLVRDSGIIKDVFQRFSDEKGEINIINSKGGKVDVNSVLTSWKNKVRSNKILAYLPDKITVESKDEVVKLLFYNVFVAENIDAAIEIIDSNYIKDEFFILTQNGELISNFSKWKKGEGAAGTGEGFLSRERQLTEINSEVLMAKEKYIAIEEEHRLQEKNIIEIESEIESLSMLYHSQYVEVAKDDERMKQKEEERLTVTASIKRAEEEQEARFREKEERIKSKEQQAALFSDKERELENMKAAIEEAANDMKVKEEVLAAKRDMLEAKRMEIMQLKNDHEVVLNEKRTLEDRLKEVESFYNNTVSEIETLAEKVKSAEEERFESERKIESDRSTLGADETEWKKSKDDYDAFKKEMSDLEKYIKEMGKERDSLRDKQYDLKIKINEISVQIKNLYDKLDEEFKVVPQEHEIDQTHLEEEEYKAMKMQTEENKEKMDKLGVINLVAIEEYNELKRRNEFLQNQYDDLSSGRNNLKKVIKKTNEESILLFTRAFNEVRKKFADVFKKMMNGGEADLILVDKDNILESGIDIIARPPGKKLQNITLLSGGEKAITAISLLFALFLTKASPFCVMDEIDAALDDINIARFTNLVKSFNDITQFIIISHNKITMETADVLYGVSMEKAGVSKILSVKLDGKEKKPLTKKEIDEKRTKKERFGGFKSQEQIEAEVTKTGHLDGEEKESPESQVPSLKEEPQTETVEEGSEQTDALETVDVDDIEEEERKIEQSENEAQKVDLEHIQGETETDEVSRAQEEKEDSDVADESESVEEEQNSPESQVPSPKSEPEQEAQGTEDTEGKVPPLIKGTEGDFEVSDEQTDEEDDQPATSNEQRDNDK